MAPVYEMGDGGCGRAAGLTGTLVFQTALFAFAHM